MANVEYNRQNQKEIIMLLMGVHWGVESCQQHVHYRVYLKYPPCQGFWSVLEYHLLLLYETSGPNSPFFFFLRLYI